jgi:hypothetical protein
VARVAADDYDADIASFRFLSLGEFVMAWKVYLPTGTVEVGSADLKRMAVSGEIEKSTIVESTTNKVRTQAVGIAGLVFKSEDVNLLDLPVPEVPQTPPTWNPPEEQTAFQEPAWTKKVEYVNVAPSGFSALFDINFNSMWTPMLLSMVWITWLVVGVLAAILQIVAYASTVGVSGSTTDRNIAIGTGFLIILGGTVVIRVTLETIAVIFKICEYLKNINDRG